MNPDETGPDLDGQRLTSSIQSVPAFDAVPRNRPSINKPRQCKSEGVGNNSHVPSSTTVTSVGSLTHDLASGNLSDLGPDLYYRTLDLSEKNLRSLGNAILNFKLICNLFVSHNDLTTLGKELGQLRNLVRLEAHNNRLTSALEFGPVDALQWADLSNNSIDDVDHVANHKLLRHLILANNKITDCRALRGCKQLKELDLSQNEIRSAEGLESLPLFTLNLKNNKMQNLYGCANLSKLSCLDLSNNEIKTLELLSESKSPIQRLNLANNNLRSVGDILPLQKLKLLHELDLRGNPVCQVDDYRELIVFLLPKLTELDGVVVSAEETVQARNLFRPDPDLCAALDHMTHTVYGILEGERVREYTMPGVDQPYPLLVLTGPPGIGKSALIERLCAEFGSAFGRAICHTTRSIQIDRNEEPRREYHFVEDVQFQELIRKGAFIQMSRNSASGDLYGLTKEALEAVAAEGRAALCHVNLDGIRTLRLTQLKPRYILIVPGDDEIYEEMLKKKEKILKNEREAENAWFELGEYRRINREQPGYFDIVIPAQSHDHAHQVLRKLVIDFLGGTTTPDGDYRPNEMSSEGPVDQIRNKRQLDSRDSMNLSSPRSRQRRQEMLLDAVRHGHGSRQTNELFNLLEIHSAPPRLGRSKDEHHEDGEEDEGDSIDRELHQMTLENLENGEENLLREILDSEKDVIWGSGNILEGDGRNNDEMIEQMEQWSSSNSFSRDSLNKTPVLPPLHSKT